MSTPAIQLNEGPKLHPGMVHYIVALLAVLAALVWLFSRPLLSADFLPHWYCFVGNARLLWTTVIADLVIGVSYVLISAALVWIARRAGREMPFTGFFWAFGIFIVSCGATHFLEILTVWKPVYWLSAATKVVTAIASAGTAVALIYGASVVVEFVHTASESAVRRGNEKFRALVQAAPMAVIGCDLKGRIDVWNPSAEAMLGMRLENIGEGMRRGVLAQNSEEVGEMLHKSFSGEVTRGYETLLLRSDGAAFSARISTAPVRDAQGQHTGVMALVEDISESKRVQQELQEKTITLSAVTQALNTFLDTGDWSAASQHLLTFAVRETQSDYGFMGVVLDGPVLRVLAHDGVVWDTKLNRELYDEKMRDHAQKGYFELVHGHNLLGLVIVGGETVMTNAPHTDPHAKGVPEGHPPVNSFLGVPIFKGQKVVGLIAVANRPGGYSDLQLRYLQMMSQATGVLYDSYREGLKRQSLEAQQKRLEAEVRQAQKMEVLGRLAGGVAHDFNNMLMVLSGSSELLDSVLAQDSPARFYLNQIRHTTEQATAITKQLLAFSRKQVVEPRPIRLGEELNKNEFVLFRLLGSDVQLKIDTAAKDDWILADASQIEQIITNLVVNARDAMPDGGSLTVSTWNASTAPDGSPAEPGREWIVLCVGDTGCGMDERTRAQIFEPFFTTKPTSKGTGLGLSTVYGIVQQCGGQIRVDSVPGKGARFEIFFPVIAEPHVAPEADTAAPAAPPPNGDVTVLVVDDEPGVRQALAEYLSNVGYRVLEAQSSAEALEMARQHSGTLDFLITDIVMPGMRGNELARRILDTHAETLVIYMSGYADGLPEAQVRDGASFLQKPFQFSTLLEQLRLVRRKA